MKDWVYRDSRIVLSKNKYVFILYEFIIMIFHYLRYFIIFFPLLSSHFFVFLDVDLHCHISFFFHSFLSLPPIFAFLGCRSPRDTLNSRWIKNSSRSNAGLRSKISEERLNSFPFALSPAGWWLFRFFSFSG